MKKYIKSSQARYFKKITSSFPQNPVNETLRHKEFKLVLPMAQKDVKDFFLTIFSKHLLEFFYFLRLYQEKVVACCQVIKMFLLNIN